MRPASRVAQPNLTRLVAVRGRGGYGTRPFSTAHPKCRPAGDTFGSRSKRGRLGVAETQVKETHSRLERRLWTLHPRGLLILSRVHTSLSLCLRPALRTQSGTYG